MNKTYLLLKEKHDPQSPSVDFYSEEADNTVDSRVFICLFCLLNPGSSSRCKACVAMIRSSRLRADISQAVYNIPCGTPRWAVPLSPNPPIVWLGQVSLPSVRPSVRLRPPPKMPSRRPRLHCLAPFNGAKAQKKTEMTDIYEAVPFPDAASRSFP